MEIPKASTVRRASVTLKSPVRSAVFVVHRCTSLTVDLLRIVGFSLKETKRNTLHLFPAATPLVVILSF